MQVAGLPLARANADKCRGRLLVGGGGRGERQRSMQSAADERRALSCVSRHIFLFGVNSLKNKAVFGLKGVMRYEDVGRYGDGSEWTREDAVARTLFRKNSVKQV